MKRFLFITMATIAAATLLMTSCKKDEEVKLDFELTVPENWQFYLYGNEGFIYSANRVAENEDDTLLEGLVIYKNHVPGYTLPLYYLALKEQIMESPAYDSLLWHTDTVINDTDFKKMVSEESLRFVSDDLTDTSYVGAITTRFFFYRNDYGYNMTFISVDTAYSLNRIVFDNIMSTFHYND